MYTSGTTGLPKGVTISHANVIACVAGIEHRMPSVNIDGPGDVYLAYMPLAHIMELAGEMNAYAIRMQVGYGSPHTLTPTGNGRRPRSSASDLVPVVVAVLLLLSLLRGGSRIDTCGGAHRRQADDRHVPRRRASVQANARGNGTRHPR